MDCTEFRDRYSEFRDATVTAPRELKRFRRHISVCAPCRAFDAALHAGVAAWRAAPDAQPSADFRQRLEARLAREAARRPVPAILVRVAAALLVAVAVTLVAREAARRPAVATTPALPPVAFPKPVANAGVPLVTFQDPRASVWAGNPNPYGTALVQPAAAVLTQPATAGR
jgi:hypothetical protein